MTDHVSEFEAALRAEEAARWATPEPTPETPAEAVPEPSAADNALAADEPAETPSEAPQEAEEDDAETQMAERIKRSHIEAREAKKRAKLLEQELEVLRGTRTETRDETVSREAQQYAQQIAQQESFNRQCNEVAQVGKKEFKDFNESIDALWEATGGTHVGLIEAAIEAGDAHRTLRWLGKNPDEAERIANLPPTRQAVAIAKIAAQVAAKPKTISKAPAPIRPVQGSAVSADDMAQEKDADPSKMTMGDYAKWADRRAHERRGRR